MTPVRNVFNLVLHPISTSDSKPRPSNYPSLAPLHVEVDKQMQFPELLLAVATVYQTIATAHLLSEVEMGCSLCVT
jgi:hypothetical protein